ncbi:peptidase domain-containing ABC transporter [Sphingomonas sanguinis]|uniref:Peptidase domain-containing ABC transporter n=1 Tax=Sphingomonas sanguinis TaxID=33051 RepID=A0ABU5LPT6_9SPHN|nr:peptidase domain-containing ABC transporter [Sphingomonas sanguinis]MDZ7281954.1 peptidase domain-containing ABC transporter [Sphingomonas sanguinis]
MTEGLNHSVRHLIQPSTSFRRRSIQPIFQSESAECGLACVAMSATHHGSSISLVDLRQRFSVSAKGTTLQTLLDISHALGLHGRALRLEVEEVPTLASGTILHWDLRHYVVYEGCTKSFVTIVDPCKGRLKLTWVEFGKHFTGVALELHPGYDFKVRKKQGVLGIRQVVGPQRGLTTPLAQIIAISLILQVFVVLTPVLNQVVIDDAIARSDLDLLLVLGGALLGLQLTAAAMSAVRSFVLIYIKNQLSFGLESNLLRHLLRQPVGWLEKRHLGDISSRFNSLKPVEDLITSVTPSAIIDIMSLMFSITFMYIYSPFLMTLEVSALLVALGVRSLAFPHIKRRSHEIVELNSRLDSIFLETLRGIRIFKLFNAEDRRVSIWQNERASAINASVRLERFQIWGSLGAGALSSIQAIVIWYIGAKLVIGGSLSLGMLIAFKAYADQFGTSSISVVSAIFTYKGLTVPLDRLADIVLAEPEPSKSPSGDVHARKLQGEIEFVNVSFRYASHEPWVLQNVSFRIDAGSFVCFVGPSGQGKTTILKLLLGFNSPSEGKILYDGIDVSQLGHSLIRSNIGAVLQDDQLLSGTIGDNISFFEPEANILQIEKAAQLASIHGEILELPMGYMTFVGDMGSSLSGGQKQRILIARALYKNPSILMLDEGTSNLDPDNEHSIMDALSKMGTTRVAIAHRDAAKAGADMVVEVKNMGVRVSRREILGNDSGERDQ